MKSMLLFERESEWSKEKQRSYANKRLHTAKCDIKIMDKVIVRNDAIGDKFTLIMILPI